MSLKVYDYYLEFWLACIRRPKTKPTHPAASLLYAPKHKPPPPPPQTIAAAAALRGGVAHPVLASALHYHTTRVDRGWSPELGAWRRQVAAPSASRALAHPNVAPSVFPSPRGRSGQALQFSLGSASIQAAELYFRPGARWIEHRHIGSGWGHGRSGGGAILLASCDATRRE